MNYLRPKKKKKKKIAVLFFTALLLVYLAIPALAQTIQELEQQKKIAQQNIDNAQFKINQQLSTVEEIEKEIITSNSVIASLETEISSLNSQISLLTQQITEKQQELDQTIAEQTKQNELMRERLKVEYMYGTDGYMEAIFSGSTPTEQLENTDIIAKILQKDQQIIKELEATKQSIETTKNQLEVQRNQVNELKNQVEAKLNQQNAIKAQQQQLLEKNKAIIAEAKSEIAKEESAIASANSEIQKIAEAAEREAKAAQLKEIQQKSAEAVETKNEILRVKEEVTQTYQNSPNSEINNLVIKIQDYANKVEEHSNQIEEISSSDLENNTAAEAVEINNNVDTKLIIILENTAEAKELKAEIEEISQSANANTQAEAEAARARAEEVSGQVKSTTGSWESDYISSTGWRWPLDNNFEITSVYGYRIHPIFGSGTGHEGVDVAASTGTSVHACDGGTVILASSNGGYGNCVIVQQNSGHQVYYAHLSEFNVSKGQKINKGDVVGYVGSTGWSTGPHLHLGVLTGGGFTDPFNFFPELSY